MPRILFQFSLSNFHDCTGKGLFLGDYELADLTRLILNTLFLTSGFPLVMLALSLVIASSQDGGVSSYVHGDL